MTNATTIERPKSTNENTEVTINKVNKNSIDYNKINEMDSFNKFVKKKNTFLFGITATFLFLYILLPILAFTPVLQQKWFGNITGVWVYSAGLFVMTVVLCTVYTKMATKFDKMATEVLSEYKDQGGVR